MIMINFFRKSSIRQFIVIYILFITAAFLSILFIDYSSRRQTEEMLIQNAQSNLEMLDKKLSSDLEEAQLSVWSIINNQEFLSYKSEAGSLEDYSQLIRFDQTFREELQQNVISSSTLGSLECYWPKIPRWLSSAQGGVSSDVDAKPAFVEKIDGPGWYVVNNSSLYYANMAPFKTASRNAENYDYLVLGKLRNTYMHDLFSSFNANNYTQTFLYNGPDAVLSDRDPKAFILKEASDFRSDLRYQNYPIETDGSHYQVIAIRNQKSSSWLVSYLNIDQALTNYKKVSGRARLLLFLLLGLALAVSVTFYRKIFTNLGRLILKLKRVEEGDYATRAEVTSATPAEFHYVYDRFNGMVSETDRLIHQLKDETVLRENAEFRQLQAQINPHFLYNNLLFIMSMAEVSPQAVISMTDHLSAYYRYLTKKYSQEVTLEQECELARHYLSIMTLRKRIDFEVILPEEFKEVSFLTLIIQPIVENSIEHGIEKRRGAKHVKVNCRSKNGGLIIEVSDDGIGMSEQEIGELREYLMQSQPKNDKSIGIWNVNRRLINKYGEASKLYFKPNVPYGLTVWFWIPLPPDQKEATDLSPLDF